MIQEAFREARGRDPEGGKGWVALVDGHETQLKILRQLFRRYGYYPLIVLAFVHVAEYVWKAGMARGEKAELGSKLGFRITC